MSQNAQTLDLIRIPAGALTAMHRVLERERGRFEGGKLLREIGLEAGGPFYELFHDWLSEAGTGAVDPEQLDSETFWRRLSEFFTHLDWGQIEHERLHEGVIALSGTKWAEAPDDQSAAAGCYFTTGLIAAILRRVAGRDLSALEVEPEANDGARFRVLIGSPEAISTVFERMQTGTPYREAVAALA